MNLDYDSESDDYIDHVVQCEDDIDDDDVVDSDVQFPPSSYILFGYSSKMMSSIIELYNKKAISMPLVFILDPHEVDLDAALDAQCKSSHDRDNWLSNIILQKGHCSSGNDLKLLREKMEIRESGEVINRIFHLYTSASAIIPLAKYIKENLMSSSGFNRVLYQIVSSPVFTVQEENNHLTDAIAVAKTLATIFPSHDLYQFQDPLLASLSEHLMTLRFSNRIFEPIWNSSLVDNIEITFKQTSNKNSCVSDERDIMDIVRDLALRVASLIAMEAPVSMSPEDINSECVKALRYCDAMSKEHCILGHCVSEASMASSTSSATVAEPLSFLKCLLHFNSPRWAGVPFVICCGNFVDEDLVEIKVTFKKVPGVASGGRSGMAGGATQNELIIRLKPEESIETFLRVNMQHSSNNSPARMHKSPSSERCNKMELAQGEMQLQKDLGYENIICDMLSDNHIHFVRSDELEARRRITTPLTVDGPSDDSVHVCSYDKNTSGPTIASLPFLMASY